MHLRVFLVDQNESVLPWRALLRSHATEEALAGAFSEVNDLLAGEIEAFGDLEVGDGEARPELGEDGGLDTEDGGDGAQAGGSGEDEEGGGAVAVGGAEVEEQCGALALGELLEFAPELGEARGAVRSGLHGELGAGGFDGLKGFGGIFDCPEVGADFGEVVEEERVGGEGEDFGYGLGSFERGWEGGEAVGVGGVSYGIAGGGEAAGPMAGVVGLEEEAGVGFEEVAEADAEAVEGGVAAAGPGAAGSAGDAGGVGVEVVDGGGEGGVGGAALEMGEEGNHGVGGDVFDVFRGDGAAAIELVLDNVAEGAGELRAQGFVEPAVGRVEALRDGELHGVPGAVIISWTEGFVVVFVGFCGGVGGESKSGRRQKR